MSRLGKRLTAALEERRSQGLERELSVFESREGILNLAGNDYCCMSKHPEVIEAAKIAADQYGVSSSASPLVTGFGPAQSNLLERLKRWHDMPYGIVWNSGYAANEALLSCLPERGDIVLADRLIHNSMISGILANGARLVRYDHCSIDALEALLEKHGSEDRQIFVVTESVFSMDGDYPDLKAIAGLKKRFPFFWVLDEAHALGWYGERGSGLAEQCGCVDSVDALVGTLGKALGSMGAYTLFHDENVARYLTNHAGAFIYSTYLSPVQAAVAEVAIELLENGQAKRKLGKEISKSFRLKLREAEFSVPDGDSPIVPVLLGGVNETLQLAQALREEGIYVGAIRPPTVPENSSRLRISLNSELSESDLNRVVQTLSAGKFQ